MKQTGYLGLWGKSVDAIDYYESEIERLSKEVSTKGMRHITIKLGLILLFFGV